jgi:hypothetical protein
MNGPAIDVVSGKINNLIISADVSALHHGVAVVSFEICSGPALVSLRALRKEQVSALDITNDIAGQVCIVERVFGLLASAFAEAVQWVNAHLKLEAAGWTR